MKGKRLGLAALVLVLLVPGFLFAADSVYVEQDWESGWGSWVHWGEPEPIFVDVEGNFAVDPNGDSNYVTASYYPEYVPWEAGFVVEFDFMTNVKKDPRGPHQAILLALSNGDDTGRSYPIQPTFYFYACPTLENFGIAGSFDGANFRMVDESYPEGEDGVWHHVRIECLKPEPEMTGDHIRFTMDDREWTFTIPEFLPEQVKVMIASRSVRMVNAFDNIVYHRAQKRQIIVSWADVKTMFR